MFLGDPKTFNVSINPTMSNKYSEFIFPQNSGIYVKLAMRTTCCCRDQNGFPVLHAGMVFGVKIQVIENGPF